MANEYEKSQKARDDAENRDVKRLQDQVKSAKKAHVERRLNKVVDNDKKAILGRRLDKAARRVKEININKGKK